MTDSIIVAKFGGTSMGDAIAMKRSAAICRYHNANIVVVSATAGTTNQLIQLGKTAETGDWPNCEKIMKQIINRHYQIADNLEISEKERSTLTTLLNDMTTLARGVSLIKDCSFKALDNMMAFGERLSSLLFRNALEQEFQKKVDLLDARDIIRTNEHFGNATPQFDEIRKLAKEHINLQNIYVTQGFIGMTDEGHTTTLGRGGSDYSAAIIAQAVNADILQIWTDVAGIATTDPRICPAALPINEMTFQEAAELATFGAKILHPTTLMPAMQSNIQVFVGSSFDAENPRKGTWIKKQIEGAPLIRAMALRGNQCLVTLRTPKMLNAHGFLYNIFKIFNDHKLSIDLVTTSEISVTVTLNDASLLNKNVVKELEAWASVEIEDGLSLVSIIGNNINHTAGLSGLIFNNLKDINIRMICSGASKHHFCFLVDESYGKESIKRLHKTFVEDGVMPL